MRPVAEHKVAGSTPVTALGKAKRSRGQPVVAPHLAEPVVCRARLLNRSSMSRSLRLGLLILDQRRVLVDRVLPRLKGSGRNELRVLLRDDPARLAKGVDDLRRDARLLHRLSDGGVVLVIGRDVDEDRIIRTRLSPIARNELLALALQNLAHLGANR